MLSPPIFTRPLQVPELQQINFFVHYTLPLGKGLLSTLKNRESKNESLNSML